MCKALQLPAVSASLTESSTAALADVCQLTVPPASKRTVVLRKTSKCIHPRQAARDLEAIVRVWWKCYARHPGMT